MAITQNLHGARAQVHVNGRLVGLFSSIAYGVNLTSQDIAILGAFHTQEVVVTGYDTIEITATGYRVVDHGPFSNEIQMGRLQDLLTLDDISLTITDRLTGETVCSVVGVKVLGFQNTIATKSVTEITIRMRGLILTDEHDVATGGQNESPGASTLI